jgi:GNAT superfamily N-acetyltransferase
MRRIKLLERTSPLFDQAISFWYTEWKESFDVKNLSELKEYYMKKENIDCYGYVEQDKLLATYSFMLHNGRSYLCDVYVVPEKRREGIGSIMVSNAIERSGDVPLYIYAERNKVPWYTKRGFHEVQEASHNRVLMKTSPSSETQYSLWIALAVMFSIVSMFFLWYKDMVLK